MITVTSVSLGLSVGDVVSVTDPRTWRQKVFDWLCWFFCDDPLPKFVYTVEAIEPTVITLL